MQNTKYYSHYSSTKAEFLATVSAAKVERYLPIILKELSLAQNTSTTLYEDSQSTIYMVNSGNPTKRSCHIDTQHFAIQDCQ
jgi:hypothetical protein